MILSILRPSALGLLSLGLAAAAPLSASAEGPELIFRKSTVFKWLTPDDKLAI